MQVSPRIDELRQKFHENPRRYFAPLANEYRKAGDPEQAIAICRAHLAQQPGHMSGHVVYGQALHDAKRSEEARVVFEKALTLDPDNTVVLRHLGDIARERGESAEARHWYTRALDLDPQDTQVAAYIAELTEPVAGDEVAPSPEAEAPIHGTVESPQLIEVAAHTGSEADGAHAADAVEAATGEVSGSEAPVAESVAAELESIDMVEEVEAVAEDVEADSEEAVAAATPAEPQGDGADPQSPDGAVTPVRASEEEAASLVSEMTDESAGEPVADREVALPETHEPEVEVEEEEEVAWRKTPKSEESPFITRTMAELYARQGYKAAALDVYRQLAISHPDDSDIRDRIAELTGEAPATPEAAPVPEVEAVEPTADETTERTGVADTRPIEPMEEPFAYAGLSDEPEFPPSSEDLNLTPADAGHVGESHHFTEMELSDSAPSDFMELADSPFGELAWEDDATLDLGPGASPEPSLETADIISAAPEPAPDEEAKVEPVVDAGAIEEEDLGAVAPVEAAPAATEEEEVPAAGPAESAVEDAAAAAESTDARFVDMPVALGEVQTSIDEAGVAATSPHDADFPPAASAERVAEAAVESVAGEDEAAAAMIEPEPPEPESAEPEEDHAVVAYSPEPPKEEDLPHFRPKSPTIREFFATLGSRRPPSRDAGPSITAHAAAPGSAAEPAPSEDLPLAADAFGNLFADSAVSEEDTRAAFAISGAMSATAHNPNPSSVRTSPPRPAPAVPEAAEPTKESEEDIRRFREWLDGLADS